MVENVTLIRIFTDIQAVKISELCKNISNRLYFTHGVCNIINTKRADGTSSCTIEYCCSLDKDFKQYVYIMNDINMLNVKPTGDMIFNMNKFVSNHGFGCEEYNISYANFAIIKYEENLDTSWIEKGTDIIYVYNEHLHDFKNERFIEDFIVSKVLLWTYMNNQYNKMLNDKKSEYNIRFMHYEENKCKSNDNTVVEDLDDSSKKNTIEIRSNKKFATRMTKTKSRFGYNGKFSNRVNSKRNNLCGYFIIIMMNIQNRNGRIYESKDLLDVDVKKFKGEREHPIIGNLGIAR